MTLGVVAPCQGAVPCKDRGVGEVVVAAVVVVVVAIETDWRWTARRFF